MGSPGYTVLCPEGHLIGTIESDIHWEDSVYKGAKRLENSRCIKCGRIAKYRLCHYGDINDCLDENSKLKWSSKENRYIIPDEVKPNLNLEPIEMPLNDEIIKTLIKRFKQSGLKIVHKSQIGNIKLPEVSNEYLHNIMMIDVFQIMNKKKEK